jgi:hypothetical protein
MRKEFWKREMVGVKLTWMAAGALFLTLWSRLRDDRIEYKRGKGNTPRYTTFLHCCLREAARQTNPG